MRSKTIGALVLLNMVLLASLCFHNALTSIARGDAPAARPAAPSEYLMVSGEVQGANGGLIFAVDTRNNLLTAFTFDGQKLTSMQPPVDLSRTFK